MELEFDKEIDAILRRARPIREPSAAGVTAHPDADVIAAFAEGSLPEKTRLTYIRHFADCDRCRKIMILSMPDAVESVATDAPARAAVVGTSMPWYQKLFQTRNLAVAMGALVLILGVGLAILVLDRGSDQTTTVARIDENERIAANRPLTEADRAVSATANSAVPAANTVPGAQPALPTADQLTNQVTRPGEPALPKTGAPSDADVGATAGTVSRPESPALATGEPAPLGGVPAPPPPAPMKKAAAQPVEESKDDNSKLADATTTQRAQTEDERKRESRFGATRDLPAPAAKGGPARSGPLNSQSQINQSNVYDMSVTRRAGGRSFNNRDGVWYDTAYRSQATLNYRRGTPEYAKLDGGLRDIAETLGGTVVVVWKGKAYRIN